MIELLQRAAAADGAAVATVTDDNAVTYAELLRMSTAMAAGLQSRGIERIAVVEPDAATVLALLAASSAVGVQVCQYAPDVSPDAAAELAERFDHTVALSRRTDLRFDRVVTPADLLAEPGESPVPPQQRPLMVLTTGTTGAPRGVLHDWGRLLRSVERVKPAPGERWLLAYGLHQFAGLQILLHVAAAGATLVAPVPRRPREGLAAMRNHGVTHASATPTYWRFLLAEMRADGGPVPALEQITLGGEATSGTLLAELEQAFPQARISHVYAASEFGSSGSVRDRREGLPESVLERGDDADVAMKVIDGELWVRSRTGMLGYYGEDSLVDPDGWRATGDLVEVIEGRIVFQGRSAEVINVGGVKVHPLPVEDRVAQVPGVAVARVFGRPNRMTGAVVAVEVVAEPGVDQDAVAQAIRERCADLPAAARPRSIRFVDELKMAGDKLVRRMP